jgi:hypothetical protein
MLPQLVFRLFLYLESKLNSTAVCKEVNGFEILIRANTRRCSTQRHVDEDLSQRNMRSARTLGDSDTEARHFMRVNTSFYTYRKK